MDNKLKSFWKFYSELKPISHGFSHGGYLLQKKSHGDLTSAFYLLTKFVLVKCEGTNFSMKKRCAINRMSLEQAVTNEPEHLVGFTLSSKRSSKTFFVKSQQLLDGWMETLSKLCVLKNLTSDYEICEEIGRGATSRVFRAVKRLSGEEVAIKMIAKYTKEAKKSFKEVDLMRRLNHGAIMQVQAVYDTDRHLCIVLDYAKGGSLYNYLINHKKTPEDLARNFIVKLLKGISHIHTNKCVHRDIKIDNILLTNPNDLLSFKISDFGLACDLKTDSLSEPCGTPGYVAPEILVHAEQSPKIDVFSAGVVLYLVLSRVFPFIGKTKNEVLRANLRCKLNLDSGIWNHISKLARDFVSKVMSKSPDKRPDAISALAHPWISVSLANADIPIFSPTITQEREDLVPISNSARIIDLKDFLLDPSTAFEYRETSLGERSGEELL